MRCGAEPAAAGGPDPIARGLCRPRGRSRRSSRRVTTVRTGSSTSSERAGLRGRGGAGFPAAASGGPSRRAAPSCGDRYVVANGAEGEPGTFKDRPLLRANPYQVLEGLAVAATVLQRAGGVRRGQGVLRARDRRARARVARRWPPPICSATRPVTLGRRPRGVPVRRGEGAARGHRGQRPDAALASALPARPVRHDPPGGLVGRRGPGEPTPPRSRDRTRRWSRTSRRSPTSR